MSNPAKGEAAEELGPRPSWQGRFKWHEDSQQYGVPTIWVLKPDLTVVGEPFFMNVYESKGALLRYSARDIAERIDGILR